MRDDISFAGAIKKTFVSWRDYKGVASRREYWFFVLFTFLLGMVTSVIDQLIAQGNQNVSFITLSNLVAIGLLVVEIPLRTRRYHDVGISGWFQLLNLAPIAVLLFQLPAIVGFIQSPLFKLAMSDKDLTDAQSVEFASQAGTIFAPLFLIGLAVGIFEFVMVLQATKPSWRGNKYAPITTPQPVWGYEFAGSFVPVQHETRVAEPKNQQTGASEEGSDESQKPQN